MAGRCSSGLAGMAIGESKVLHLPAWKRRAFDFGGGAAMTTECGGKVGLKSIRKWSNGGSGAEKDVHEPLPGQTHALVYYGGFGTRYRVKGHELNPSARAVEQ